MDSMTTIPFIGRYREQRILRNQLDRTCREGTRLVLLYGPAGTGKTALIRHVMTTSADGCIYAEGRGWDNRAAVPYQAVREAVQQLIRKRPHWTEHPDIKPFQAYLNTFLNGRGGAEIAALPVDVFFRGLARLFQASAGPALCVFLDDLQWGDEGTFEWLDFALREMEDAPVLWIGAYRSEEGEALESLLGRRERWSRADRFYELPLNPLSQAEIEELTRRTVPMSAWHDALPQQIWQRSEGVALFAVEEIRAHCEGETAYPSGQALISHRLRNLSKADRDLLSYAALMGERFSVKPLAIAIGIDALEAAKQLADLASTSGILVADEQGFRFAHSRYREALLDDLAPAWKQMLHSRLSRISDVIPPEERAYHLVQAGDLERGVEALIEEGNRAMDLVDWRDALRYYMEAQWRAAAGASPRIRCMIYERIGYVQFHAAREPEIARGYYEAALSWARSPQERIVLLCRLAETYPGGMLRARYLEEAMRILKHVQGEHLGGLVLCLQAEKALGEGDLDRAYQMAERALHSREAPEDIAIRSRCVLMQVIGTRRNREELQGHARYLEALSPYTWTTAQFRSALARAYEAAGWPSEALRHMEEATRLFEALGREAETSDAYAAMGAFALKLGAYKEARSYLKQALQRSAPRHEIIYTLLCKTWVYDHHPHGVQWAAEGLQAWVEVPFRYPSPDGSLGTLLHRFGPMERIFRETGQSETFRRQLTASRKRLKHTGYHTEGIWYLDTSMECPAPSPVQDRNGWSWTPGSQDGAFAWHGPLVLRTAPLRGFNQMDMPRMMCRVSGEFTLQATLDGAEHIASDVVRCRCQARTGEISDQADGGGGLLILRDKHNALRLFVHVQEPGEVLCEIRQEERRRILGRGLLGDGRICLQIERRGRMMRTYAGNEGGAWYLCGEIELPDWDTVEIGVYGECPVYLYAIVKQTETRFHEIRLDAPYPQHDHTPDKDPPYPRPKRHPNPDFPEVVAEGKRMQKVLEYIRRAAASDVPVLIYGETGTGKELVARALHRMGPRAEGPFVPINCAAIAPDLLERELFGHIRGAYTGAYEARGGLFEAAHGGILLLDEIGEASLAFQAHLLRVIEEQAVRRVGDPRLKRVDVRIIAATNKDLVQTMEEGTFRKDLYFRLVGQQIYVPPLRERREEIPYLAYHALDAWCRKRETPSDGFTKSAMDLLMRYEWPGNVREFIYEVERAAGEADGERISHHHLSLPLDKHQTELPPPSYEEERLQIEDALQASEGNRSETARRLNISRATLYRRMRRLGIR